jgi:hypothetical protein
VEGPEPAVQAHWLTPLAPPDSAALSGLSLVQDGPGLDRGERVDAVILGFSRADALPADWTEAALRAVAGLPAHACPYGTAWAAALALLRSLPLSAAMDQAVAGRVGDDDRDGRAAALRWTLAHGEGSPLPPDPSLRVDLCALLRLLAAAFPAEWAAPELVHLRLGLVGEAFTDGAARLDRDALLDSLLRQGVAAAGPFGRSSARLVDSLVLQAEWLESAPEVSTHHGRVDVWGLHDELAALEGLTWFQAVLPAR